MKNDLRERYIYAVTRKLPAKISKDVSEELETLIDDMLMERCGDVTPTEKDLRVVLTELGTPKELYEKYTDEGKDCLIGFPYYSDYKFILKVVLICVLVGVAIASLFSEILNPSPMWYEGITKWFEAVLDVIPSTFMVITLGFAICYHKGININLNGDFDFDNLPPVPDKRNRISKVESIVGIVFSVAFFIIFLFAPQILGFVRTGTSEFVPVFNTEIIQSSWLLIALFTICGVTRDTARLIEGRYCNRVMIITIITNVITAVTTAIWLLGTNIMNPELINSLSDLFSDEAVLINLFSKFQVFLLAIILFALAIDTIETVVKTLRKS